MPTVVGAGYAGLTAARLDPRLRLSAIPGLNGLIAVQPPKDPGFHIVDASASNSVATMMLIIPQLAGRDLNDLDIVARDGVEWTRWGCTCRWMRWRCCPTPRRAR